VTKIEGEQFEARVHAPTRWHRLLGFAPPFVIALGCAVRFLFGLSAGPVVLAGALLIAAAWTLKHRRRARIATVELGAGGARILEQGFGPSLTVKARALRGLSAAHFEGKTLVSLDDRGKLYGIEVHDPEDAKRLRAALGVGHFGFGEVHFPLKQRVFHLLASLALVVFLIPKAAIAAPIVALIAWAVGSLIGKQLSASGWLIMTSEALLVPGLRLRYQDIRFAGPDGNDIVIEHTGGITRILAAGLSAIERAHAVAQIRDASRRARGRIAPPPEIPELIASLAQSQHDPAAFIAALDSNAERLLKSAGYRGGTMSEGELWETLENHDAPREVRCAAARMLVRSSKAPDARDRIERAARSSREVATERLILAAVRPLDEAVREIEAIQEAELEKGVLRYPMRAADPAPMRTRPGR